MAFIHLQSFFLLNAEQIDSHICPVSLYAFDFKLHTQGCILINSKSCSLSSEAFSWLLNACCHGDICYCWCCCCFKALTKAQFTWINSFSTALLKSRSGWFFSRLNGVVRVVGGVKRLLVLDNLFDSSYLQEYKVKQFHLIVDYVKILRNLIG